MTIRLRFTLAAFAVLVLAVSAAGQPPADAKVAQTLADWKTRRERLKSVRYTLSGVLERVAEREIPPELKGSVIPDPPGGKEKRLEFKILLDFVNGRVRVEDTQPVPSLARDRWVPRLRVTAFNGTAYQQAHPREKNDRGADEADISISKGNLGDREVVESDLWPVFMAHGIVPTVDSPLRIDRLLAAHDAEDFVVRGTVSHVGRQCVSLGTNPTGSTPTLSDEFWVDPGRQSAIVRHVYFQGKKPLFRMDIEHAETPHGWLPQKWTHTTTQGGKVTTIVRWTVESVEANPLLRDEDFTIPLKPGMIVSTHDYPASGKGLDTARPAKGKYRVGADGELEPIGPQTGFTTREGIQLPPEAGSRRWLWWGLAATGGVLALIAGVVIWKRRVKSKQTDVV